MSSVYFPAIRALSGPLRLEYIQYRELLRISKLKTTGQTDEQLQKIKAGNILTEVIKQDKDAPVSSEAQVMIFQAYKKKILHEMTIPEVNQFQLDIFEYAKKKNPGMLKSLREKRKIDPEIEKGMDEILTEYLKEIQAKRPKEEEDKEENVPSVGVDVLNKAAGKPEKKKAVKK